MKKNNLDNLKFAVREKVLDWIAINPEDFKNNIIPEFHEFVEEVYNKFDKYYDILWVEASNYFRNMKEEQGI